MGQDQWVYNVGMHQDHLEGLLEHRFLSPTPEPLIQRVQANLSSCVSNYVSGDVDAPSPDITLWKSLSLVVAWKKSKVILFWQGIITGP